MYYRSIKFGVDSSSRFPFRVWTHRQKHKVTNATMHPNTNDHVYGAVA